MVRVVGAPAGGETFGGFRLDVEDILARLPDLEHTILASSVTARQTKGDTPRPGCCPVSQPAGMGFRRDSSAAVVSFRKSSALDPAEARELCRRLLTLARACAKCAPTAGWNPCESIVEPLLGVLLNLV
jgi:hypothetical protein